jgi:hypothetical protein
MIRFSNGWAIPLADLALILFMVTAQAVHEGDLGDLGGSAPSASAHPVAGNPLPAEGQPLAIYRAGNNAPPLRQWLARQGADDRAQLTIIAHHSGADMAAAVAAATTLAAAAGQGAHARIVVEPGAPGEVLAVLAYDRAPAAAPTGWHGDCKAGTMNSRKDTRCD